MPALRSITLQKYYSPDEILFWAVVRTAPYSDASKATIRVLFGAEAAKMTELAKTCKKAGVALRVVEGVGAWDIGM